MVKTKIGIKFCGHCNPYVDGQSIIREISLLRNRFEFVRWEDPDIKVLLIFSACESNCVDAPEFSGPIINIMNCRIDGLKVSVQEIPEIVCRKIDAKLCLDR